MATITPRKRKDGTTGWLAEVRIKREGVIIHREAKTFDRRPAAESWAKRLEIELEAPGAIAARKASGVTVASGLTLYKEEVGVVKPFGKNKAAVVDALISSELGSIPLADLSPRAIVDHAKRRRAHGAGPVTITIDLSYLGTALRWLKAIHRVGPGDLALVEARPHLQQMGLVGKSQERDRRLEPGEYEALTRFFDNRVGGKGVEIPMDQIFRFAVATAMRLSEICRIRWSDVSDARRTVVIRDRKDPKEKAGNDQEVPLLGEAWDIVQRQPKTEAPEIFPFDPRSVSAAFSRATDRLGLDDLTFHDLRHEGVCRLFELGYAIEEVAMVSGHKNWKTLQRYTHLRPEHLHRDIQKPSLPAYEPPTPPSETERAQQALTVLRAGVRQAVQGGKHPLAAWREALGMEQAQLAERAGITLSRYRFLEISYEGRAEMRVSEMVMLIKALGVRADDLTPALW